MIPHLIYLLLLSPGNVLTLQNLITGIHLRSRSSPSLNSIIPLILFPLLNSIPLILFFPLNSIPHLFLTPNNLVILIFLRPHLLPSLILLREGW